MYFLIGLMFIALVGLGIMFVMNMGKEPQVIEKVVQVPGAVQDKDDGDKDKDKDDKDKDDKDKDKDKAKDEDGDDEGSETGGEEVDATGKPVVKKPTGTVKKPTGSTTGGSTTGGVAGTTGGSTTTTTGGSSGGSSGGAAKDPDVDCLLDPNLAKCKGGGKTTTTTKPAADPSLPAKLGTAEIKSGIDGVRAAASACGPKNSAAAGTTVGIKFSVKGSTGTVTSATATGTHAGTALGKCVEAEAKKAQFPKFQADSQGFQFNFRM
jgi:hypothetical protein